MEINDSISLDSLQEQLFVYQPNLKSSEEKEKICNKLRYQLIESKAVVRLQHMDSECERLMTSLKQRLMLLQDALIPKRRQQKVKKGKQIFELNLSDSSEDEMLNTLVHKKIVSETPASNICEDDTMKCVQIIHADSSEDLPLALRRNPRERKQSYKSYSSSTTNNSRYNTKSYGKLEETVSTSGEVYHNEEILVDEINSTPTLHIKIPSLHRDNVHYIVLDSLKFARKAFDFRAREVKQQQQQQTVILETKIKKSHKKQIKTLESGSFLQQLSQQDQDADLSQLIQDVMAEAINDETLHATNALENINNNLLDNYAQHTNSLLSYSQSSQEMLLSQNNTVKKPRKNAKRSNEKKSDEPPKKRGRKPKKKNISVHTVEQLQHQPPTKSNLAKYVEYFANDCNQFIPGSSTPAASSTMSQPLVSSTTHNFEVMGQQEQVREQQQQQPITYYIDGDWANGGPCQLVPTNSMSVDFKQLNSDDLNVPFEEIVNYIDNNSEIGNNVVARFLEYGNSLPISIPLPIANVGLQNFTQSQVNKKSMQSKQVSSVPIINIQIPNLPNGLSAPPPAHSHEDILDLTVKPKNKINIISTEVINISDKSNNNIDTSVHNTQENCLPLDLSKKNSENNCVTIDDQDEDFIRHLIETSDFDYTSVELNKNGNSTNLPYDDRKSFKAALDMPLLEFDNTEVTNLVKDPTASNNNNEQDNTTDNFLHNDGAYINDSNYVTMLTENTSVENHLQFSDNSTKEIFDKLLDIDTDEKIIENTRIENISIGNCLHENDFCQIKMQNSTMCEVKCSEISEPVPSEKATNEKQNKELFILSMPEDITTQLEERDLDNCRDKETTSCSHQNENNVCDDPEDLNSSLSSEVTLNLKFSDTKESSKVNIPNHERILKSKEDNCLNFESTNQLDVNKILCKDGMNKTEMNCKNTKIEKDCSNSTSSDTNHIKTKEKIVFSVSKVALSDEDNLYTDSDTASGKSFDFTNKNKINTLKYIDTNLTKPEENKNVTEVTVSSKSDGGEHFLDNNVKDNTTNNELGSKQGLTLLDLESKLDDSLDFDEDFDDALSLETSCFNSPNDDRFLDSVIEQTIPDKSEEISFSSNDLNTRFKIPKMKNSNIQSSSIDVENNERTLYDTPVENKTFSEMDKITRTVANDAAAQSPLCKEIHINSEENEIIISCLKDKTVTYSMVFINLFGITCLPYLVDKCLDPTNCLLSHQYNDPGIVFERLNTLSVHIINLCYEFHYNHKKLFRTYFKVFCTYYTTQKNRNKLLNMVNDCERYPECALFIFDIYEGLLKCGFSRANACRQILKRSRNTSTPILDALVALILKSDWTLFSDYIEKYTKEEYKYNFRINVLEQMAPAVLKSKEPHLKEVFGKCVQMLHYEDTGLLVNCPILIQCVALLTQT